MEAMMNTANMLEKRSTMILEQAKADGIITPAEEKFAELIRDEAFAAALNNCGSAEAVKELLDKNGVDFSMEEIHAMLVVVGTLFQKLEENDGELTDEDLEQIAGGTAITSPVVTPAVLFKQDNGVVNVYTEGNPTTIKPAVLFSQDHGISSKGKSM
jgi:hypothetical protein